MAQVDVYNVAGEVVGQIELNSTVFGIEPNTSVVHQAVVCQLANARQGTSDTKTRGEVNASGAKPWRQKGTGRARQGSRRAPHFKGGGVAFGPHPRSYEQRLPRKMRRLALRSVLSAKVGDNQLMVVDRLEMDAPRTKAMLAVLQGLKVEGKAMIVMGQRDKGVTMASRNIPGLMTVTPDTMNLIDLLSRDRVVMTVDAVNAVSEWLGAR